MREVNNSIRLDMTNIEKIVSFMLKIRYGFIYTRRGYKE